ncbi:DUF3048 domain-containing protein [Chloroflexota bacterium]
MKHLIWIFILALALGACASEVTQMPTEVSTSAPTKTSTSIPTATLTTVPPTSTITKTPPLPTATEYPTEAVDQLANYPTDGYGPVDFPENVNPLTGLQVENPTILDRRPVAVKISNYPREIRPQWGLSKADHVFEYYHEGGLTRFHAIFYGTDVEEVGPIRSARFLDEHLIRAYKSVFAFGSADYRVRWRLYNAEFSNRLASVSDKPCPPDTTYPTCRIDPNQWNHLMTNTSVLSQHFTDQSVSNGRQYLDGLRFTKQPPDSVEDGRNLKVRYSSDDYHKWEYDPDSGRYYRFHDAATDIGEGETFELLVDRYNNQPISADNIVVIFANYSFFSRQPEMMEVDLSGSGRAYVFRDGQAYDVKWARINDNEIISLIYEDGSRFPLKPGSTWFDIVGSTSEIQAENTDWNVQFKTP